MTEAAAEIIPDGGTQEAANAGAEQPGNDNSNPAPAAQGGAGDTALTAGGEGKAPASAPDDWKALLAGGNDDIGKLVGRYSSLANVGKALLEKERLIREGKPKVERPTDPKDEKAMAEWRKSVGIPDDPTGYQIPDDVKKILTDEDKPVMADFTEFAHKEGITPDGVAGAVKWYAERQAAAAELQHKTDAQQKEQTEDSLRSEWGNVEFKENLTLAKRFLDESPLGAAGWAGMRLSTGQLLGNHPDFMKWAAQAGRDKFGDGVFASSDTAAAHESRRKEIERIRDTDFDRYEREFAQEYRSIIEKDMQRKK